MKVIILGAGMGTRLGDLTENLPKCLIPFKGTTILENSISILKEVGIKEEDIYTVAGYMADKVKKVAKNVIVLDDYDTTAPPYGTRFALEYINKKDDYLIIDGDLVFEKSLIRELLKEQYNSLVTYTAKTPIESGSRIEIKEGTNLIKSIGRYISPPFPFQIHAGITYIKKEDYNTYKTLIFQDRFKRTEMHIFLNEFCKEALLYPFSIDKEQLKGLRDSNELTGGSFSEVIKTKDSDIIKKQCKNDTKRLENEIQFLKNLPETVKPYFTELIDHGQDNKEIWYTMKHYNLLSLKKLLLSGQINAKQTVDFVARLMKFMKNNIYSMNKQKCSENYIHSVHYHRVLARKDITISRASVFEDIFNAHSVYLNNVEYTNVIPLINQMIQCEELTKILTPDELCMVHGDLHFDNILVDITKDPFDFKLVDPKGFKAGDPMYDVSKIIHNYNGLYDFFFEYLFNLDYKVENGKIIANMEIKNCKALNEYKKIADYLPMKLDNIFEESNWYTRAKFIEAINFCSLQPFHLVGDGKEDKAIAMYFMGVKLLNNFWDMLPTELKSSGRKHKVVNINTVEDFTYAQNLFKNTDNEKFPGV